MNQEANDAKLKGPQPVDSSAPGRPATMPAPVVRATGGRGSWNVLEWSEVPRPAAAAEEVLVQVEACSVNRADLLQRRGLYPPPPGASTLLGLDFAGYVVHKGTAVGDDWRLGDRVFGVVAGGAYGRYLAVDADHLLAIPDNLSFVEAAAAAEVFLTAYLNLFVEAGLQAGETLLVHGGAGGVGSAAIQLGAAAGARVLTTLGDINKRSAVLALGAAAVVDHRAEDWPLQIRAASGHRGVDVILDWIGAPYLRSHLDLLREGGRMVVIGLMGGREAPLDLAPLLSKRLRLLGSMLRTRSRRDKAQLVQAFRRDVLPLLEQRKVWPLVYRIYPMEQVEAAHLCLKEGGHLGKIVLSWSAASPDPAPLPT